MSARAKSQEHSPRRKERVAATTRPSEASGHEEMR